MSNQEETRKQSVKKLNFLYRIFCWCGGANIKILEGLESEYNKFFGSGFLIILVGLLASFSGGYAISTILEEDSFLPFILGPIWGIFIFSLDRLFVSSMIRRDSDLRYYGLAIPRLLLAVFIGIVVSRPVELAVCEPEIKDQLRYENEAKIVEIDTKYNDFIAKVDAEISAGISGDAYNAIIEEAQRSIRANKATRRTEDSLLQVYFEEFECERNGTCGSMKVGPGQRYKDRKKRYEDYRKEINSTRPALNESIREANNIITQTQKSQDSVNRAFVVAKGIQRRAYVKQRDSLKKVEGKEFATSFLNRNKALSAITKGDNDNGASTVTTLLMILFILLECTPVAVKILLPKGPYDEAYMAVEERLKRETMIDNRLVREEYKLNSLLINKLALSQRSIVQEKLEEWKEAQLDEDNVWTNGLGFTSREELKEFILSEMVKKQEEDNRSTNS